MDILEKSRKLNRKYLDAKENKNFSKSYFKNEMKKEFNDLFESMESVFNISISDNYNYYFKVLYSSFSSLAWPSR